MRKIILSQVYLGILFLCFLFTENVQAAPVGDFNNDGKVDIFDYTIFVTDFGKTGTNLITDLNKNGKVDIFDYTIFISNFGKLGANKTILTIEGSAFHINGKPTYQGVKWNNYKIEGLLMNSRMVQGIFDDLNSETVSNWIYSDTKKWDSERNTNEFIASMSEWRKNGLLALTINLQGGSPEGYPKKTQPWHNSAIASDGSLRSAYMKRLERILDKADQLGMAVILGYFYFGQDERISSEVAVIKAVDNVTKWVLERDYRNVMIEINNECDVRYDHVILKCDRVHELINRVKQVNINGNRLLVSTSFRGAAVPTSNVVQASDFILLHGNGVSNPDNIVNLVKQTKAVSGYKNQPILFNEDDHYDFDKPWNNFVASVSEYASWGFFDYRRKGEGFDEGYQSVPVNWAISSDRKRDFFGLVKKMTGGGSVNDLTQPIAGSDLVFEETGGLAAVEAEHFYKQTLKEKRAWYLTSSSHTPGITPDPDPKHLSGVSRGAYMEILPDTRVTDSDPLVHGESFSNTPGVLAILHYRVYFNNPGRYYVWARAYSIGPEDNGLHVGLNGKWPASGQRLQWCNGKNTWRWDSMQRTTEVHCGVPDSIYLDIPSAGEHEIIFSMREDGFEFDKFILTKDINFARPADAGPEVKVRQGTLPPAL